MADISSVINEQGKFLPVHKKERKAGLVLNLDLELSFLLVSSFLYMSARKTSEIVKHSQGGMLGCSSLFDPGYN